MNHLKDTTIDEIKECSVCGCIFIPKRKIKLVYGDGTVCPVGHELYFQGGE